MIRHISEYIKCLQRLDSTPLKLDMFIASGCTARELKILDMLISGHPLTDDKAENILYPTNRGSRDSSYRKTITRLQQKLDALVWNALMHSNTPGKHQRVIEIYKHVVIGEVMGRVGSRVVAKRHLAQARLLTTSPDHIAHEFLANGLALLLASSQGDLRGTETLIEWQEDCLREAELIHSLNAPLATMRACGTATPSRARRMESIAAGSRAVVNDLIRSNTSTRVLESVSRLAVAIAQVDADPEIAMRALDAHRRALKKEATWTEIDERDHYLQKAFVLQSVAMPAKAITFLRKAILLIRPRTLQWFTASESLLDCLLKTAAFDGASRLSQDLLASVRSASIPDPLRARILIRCLYAEALVKQSVRTGQKRRKRIRGSNEDLHTTICRIINTLTSSNGSLLDELTESLLRAVTRSADYQRDRALVLFARLLRTYATRERSLAECRTSKRFLRWEQELNALSVSPNGFAIVPWNILWKNLAL